jgi:hypothetical protein
MPHKIPNQKFAIGSRVRIIKNLGPSMPHFPSGKNATVKYTYAYVYGGNDYKSYCLDVDDIGEVSWYYEQQLKSIPAKKKQPKKLK